MKKNIIKCLTCLVLVCLPSLPLHSAIITIGSFANGDFTVDSGSSYSPTQSSSGLTTTGTVAAGDTFYGLFTGQPLNWTTYTNLSLLMSATSTAPVAFSVYLVDSTNGTSQYSGTTAGLTSTPSTNPLTLVAAGADFSSISSFVFAWDAPGTSVNSTLGAIQAVPEPATSSLLLLGGLGLVALRRLRKV